MVYVHFHADNGYCGCDYDDYLCFDYDITDSELDEISEKIAIKNAENYEHLAWGWDDNFKTKEEELEEYYANVDFYWEKISKEEFEET